MWLAVLHARHERTGNHRSDNGAFGARIDLNHLMGRAELAQCCIGGFCATVIEACHGDAACNLAFELVCHHMHRTGTVDEGLHAARHIREIVGRSHDDAIRLEHLLLDLFHVVIFDAAFWLE